MNTKKITEGKGENTPLRSVFIPWEERHIPNEKFPFSQNLLCVQKPTSFLDMFFT